MPFVTECWAILHRAIGEIVLLCDGSKGAADLNVQFRQIMCRRDLWLAVISHREGSFVQSSSQDCAAAGLIHSTSVRGRAPSANVSRSRRRQPGRAWSYRSDA